jgi:hypothetical protein
MHAVYGLKQLGLTFELKGGTSLSTQNSGLRRSIKPSGLANRFETRQGARRYELLCSVDAQHVGHSRASPLPVSIAVHCIFSLSRERSCGCHGPDPTHWPGTPDGRFEIGRGSLSIVRSHHRGNDLWLRFLLSCTQTCREASDLLTSWLAAWPFSPGLSDTSRVSAASTVSAFNCMSGSSVEELLRADGARRNVRWQ